MKLPPLVAENQLGSAAVELQPIDLPMQGSAFAVSGAVRADGRPEHRRHGKLSCSSA